MKTIAVIPCYNEQLAIGDVVREARRHTDGVIVVNDGSMDGTGIVARSAGAEVVALKPRRGAGMSTVAGARTALMHRECAVVVTLDGDGQHDAREIPKVAEPVLAGRADIAVGVRPIGLIKGDGMPRYRRFGIDVITWLYNVGAKRKVVDGQCCFRAYSRRLLEVVEIEERGFGFSTEVLVKARALGFRVAEVPVSCIYRRERSLDSTLNPILHGLGVALATIKWRIKAELFRNGRR